MSYSIPRQQYDAQKIYLSVRCAIEGCSGFRCIARVFNLLREQITSLFAPCSSSIRLWALRTGLYMLMRPKVKGEWIYIIDVSIQMGSMKCLLILGVEKSRFKKTEKYTVCHEDVEPLVMKPVHSCTGEVVCEALLEAEKKTGTPERVVSDQGSELKRGVNLFNGKEKKVIHQFDIIHKIDTTIKKEIQNDSMWKEFSSKMTEMTQKIKLTEYAHLIAPKQRQKKRMLGEISIVEWAVKLLRYIDRGNIPKQQLENIGWLCSYREWVWSYRQIACFCKLAIREVHQNGLYRGVSQYLLRKHENMILSDKASVFLLKIISAIKEEEMKVAPGECVFGTSEIVESVFGKFKQLEKHHASGGLTSLILCMPMLVGKLSIGLIEDALNLVSVSRVSEWINKNLGKTYWSQRRKDLGDQKSKKNSKNHLKIDLDLDEELSTC